MSDELTAQLSAYLDDALDPAERTVVESQLSASPEARAMLEELRGVKSLVIGLPRAGAPDDLVEALSEHIERQALLGDAEPLHVPVERRPWQLGKLLATAAVFAIVCTAGFIVMMQLQSSDAPITTVALVQPEEAQSETQESRATSVTRVAPPPVALEIKSEDAEREIELRLTEADKGDRATPSGPATDGDDLAFADAIEATDQLVLAPGNAQGLTRLARKLSERVGSVFWGLRQTTSTAPSKDRNAVAVSNLPGASLEQKVEAGLPLQSLASHVFDNESVRLDLVAATAADRTQVDQRIQTFFANNGIVAAETLAQESAVAPTQAFYLPGQRDVNYTGYSTSESTSSRVYAVRLAPTQLAALLGELQSGEPGRVRLQTLRVGPAVSQDWASATQLARMIAPASEVNEEAPVVAINEALGLNFEAGKTAVPSLRTAGAGDRANGQAADEHALWLNRSTQAAAPTEPTPAVALRGLNQKLREEQFDGDALPASSGRLRTPRPVTERLTRRIARAPARTTQPETETLAKVKVADADPVAVALDAIGKAGVPIAAKPEANIASAASRPTLTRGARSSFGIQPDAGGADGAGSRGAVAQDDRFYFGAARAKTAPATAPAAPADKPEPLLTLVLALHGPPVTTSPTSSPVAGRPLTTTQPDAP